MWYDYLIAGVIYYRSQPEWAVLYSNLPQEDAQAVRLYLEESVMLYRALKEQHALS